MKKISLIRNLELKVTPHSKVNTIILKVKVLIRLKQTKTKNRLFFKQETAFQLKITPTQITVM
jgi:hypothetical protein